MPHTVRRVCPECGTDLDRQTPNTSPWAGLVVLAAICATILAVVYMLTS